MDSTSTTLISFTTTRTSVPRFQPGSELRLMDLALAVIHGKLLALIYTERGNDVRVISFRPASREEREQYERDKE